MLQNSCPVSAEQLPMIYPKAMVGQRLYRQKFINYTLHNITSSGDLIKCMETQLVSSNSINHCKIHQNYLHLLQGSHHKVIALYSKHRNGLPKRTPSTVRWLNLRSPIVEAALLVFLMIINKIILKTSYKSPDGPKFVLLAKIILVCLGH